MLSQTYLDDGVLPRIKETVIHDDRTGAEDMFKEETTGMSEHPAELLNASSREPDPESSHTMIDKTGVIDPKCDQMPGRLFTTAAIKTSFQTI